MSMHRHNKIDKNYCKISFKIVQITMIIVYVNIYKWRNRAFIKMAKCVVVEVTGSAFKLPCGCKHGEALPTVTRSGAERGGAGRAHTHSPHLLWPPLNLALTSTA